MEMGGNRNQKPIPEHLYSRSLFQVFFGIMWLSLKWMQIMAEMLLYYA